MAAGVVGQYSEVNAELYGDTTFSARNLAAYFQLEKKFFDRLNLSAGFRYENNLLRNPGFESQGFEVAPRDEEESQPVLRIGAIGFYVHPRILGAGLPLPDDRREVHRDRCGGLLRGTEPGFGF